jgi:hypothetical protein
MKARICLAIAAGALCGGALVALWTTSPVKSAKRLTEHLTQPLSPKLVAADDRVLRSAKRLAGLPGFEARSSCVANWCRMWFSRGYTLSNQPRETVYVTIEATLVPEFVDLEASVLLGWRVEWSATAWTWTVTIHDSTSPPAGRSVSGDFKQMDRFPTIPDLPLLRDFAIAMHEQLRERVGTQLP